MRRRSILKLSCAFFIAAAFTARPSRAACPKPVTTTTPWVNIPCASGDPRWEKAYELWDRRAEDEAARKALKLFEAIAADKPNSARAWLWVARAGHLEAMRAGKGGVQRGMEAAVQAADRALELDPGNEHALYWRFAALIHVRDLAEHELSEFRELIDQEPFPRTFPVPDDDPLWLEAMADWDNRTSPESARAAEEKFRALYHRHPDRIEPRVWLCISTFWLGRTAGEDARADLFKRAAQWGRMAIDLEPRNPAANYFTAMSLSRYVYYTGFTHRVLYSLEITRQLTVVAEEDPQFDWGGFARFYALAVTRGAGLFRLMLERMGFSNRTLEKSIEYAAEVAPYCFKNKVILAAWRLEQGEREKAKALLDEVLAADPSAIEIMEPENLMARQRAARMKAENF